MVADGDPEVNGTGLLIRPTRSLLKKLKASLEDTTSPKSSLGSLSEWYCNDFRFARTDLALFVNAETFLPLVLRAAPYRDLIDRFSIELSEYVTKLGYSSLAPKPTNQITFAKTADRSVLGVITQFIKELEAEDYLGRIQPNETWAMTARLGKTLIGGPNYKTPMERLAERAGNQTGPASAHLRLVT